MAEAHGLTTMLLIFLEFFLVTHSKVLLPDANVTCIIPDDCILPCSFRPTGTVVIHWYKQQIPVHSFYYNRDQFGLQNKHFSGRTCLFNAHIPQGNASLLLRRVKVQDKGRYKCYTSTRKGSQEMFVNLEVKALIQSVIMEMSDDTATCSSHSIYPVPQVTWTTDPPSAQENSTLKTTDHKGLLTVVSSLRILGNPSNYTYFCSFTSADKTQVWTASRKNQEAMTAEEGQALSIPCIAPHSQSVHNLSLTWSFTSSCREPTVIFRYDTKTRHTFNLWEGQADLDEEKLLVGNASLVIHKPDTKEHSGTYTCAFSGLQSKHVVKTKVNVTVSSISVNEQRVQRSWWSTAASAAFVLFTIIVALPHCVRQRALDTRTSSHRYNGASFVEDGPQKDLNNTVSHSTEQQGAECSGPQPQSEAQGEPAGSTVTNAAEDCCLALTASAKIDGEEEKAAGGPRAGGNDGLQFSSLEIDGCGNGEPGNHIP